MRFGSVCSGIEAASVAFEPLGWSAAWLAEIEPFPSAVLAHHYPDVPNLGDMTAIPRRVLSGEIEAPDMLCGGTPCQAFSVAGLRESLSDERGNLTLTFVEIADAIDHVRARRGAPPAIILWENVPGVLSTRDNAFGCFLAGLAGEDDPLEPPGGRWANAGAVYGPERAVAWRLLDAQFFALAQRRRRVFVVASAREGFDPATVLFEWDGLRRDSAPSREARQVAPTIPARSTAGGGLGTDFDCDGGLIEASTRRMVAFGEYRDDGSATVVQQPTPTMQVRRPTPRECERLMGFPDDYTLIPWKAHQAWAKRKGTNAAGQSFEQWLIETTGRGLREPTTQDCPDGPRYRALGNSWAIPVVRWIGQRIDSVLSRGQTRPSHVEAAQKRSTPESGEQRRDRTGS